MNLRRTFLISSVLLSLSLASTAFAAGGGESPWTTSLLVWRVINTLALIVLLGYFLKKPLVTFFSERTAQIEMDLQEAKDQREKAERLIKDYEQKIAGMEQELQKMRAELQKAADAESAKVVSNAERMASGMVEAAKMAAEQEVRKAKIALKNEAVALAVEMAESLVREKINEDDRKRLVEEYFVKVGGMK